MTYVPASQRDDRRNRALRDRVISEESICWLCGGGQLQLEGERWTVDHVVALVYGGLSVRDNMHLAHSSCNSWRGSKPVTPALLETIAKRRRIELFVQSP